MFTGMLTPFLNHVHIMFIPCLKTCFHQTWRFVYTMLEDMFCNTFEDKLKPCSMTCLHHVYFYVYTMLEFIFPPYLTISFHNVGGHVCNVFEDEFLPLDILWRFLPLNFFRHDILLQFFKSENVNYIISKYLEIEKICLTNLDFVQSYAPNAQILCLS